MAILLNDHLHVHRITEIQLKVASDNFKYIKNRAFRVSKFIFEIFLQEILIHTGVLVEK